MGTTGASLVKKPFSLTDEIFRQARDGWTFSKTTNGELYLGPVEGGYTSSIDTYSVQPMYAKDTPENRERFNYLWEASNFSRELKDKKKFKYDKRGQ